MTAKHQAAILPQKGGPLHVGDRRTPELGPNEVLIEVWAIGLNPFDHFQRDLGMPPVPFYPDVIGSDVASLVAKVGFEVSNCPPSGSRVIAFASSYYQSGSPDHGAFHKYVFAQSEAVTPLPGAISFDEGAVFPMAVLTALSGCTTIGIPLDTSYTSEDKQAVLIWGGASSVGSFAIQSAKLMRFKIYTTASVKNHEYLQKLGADAVSDYNTCEVVSRIRDTKKNDEVIFQAAYCAVEGSLQLSLHVLQDTKDGAIAKVAYALPLLPGAITLEGAEIKFVHPLDYPTEREEYMRKCFHLGLREGLESGTVVPSPKVQVVAGGLVGLNRALRFLKAGVSGTKIVVQV